MSKELLISMLRKGETGEQILKILDTITEPESDMKEPTLDEIEF